MAIADKKESLSKYLVTDDLVAVTPINRVKSIVKQLTPYSGFSTVEVYQNPGLSLGSEFLPGHKIVSYNCFLKNLRVYASIKSLPVAPLPVFRIEDSETEKLMKTLDIEYKSPRKQLNAYIGIGSDPWLQVGSVSLLNPYGYPFRTYNLMDLYTDGLTIELGENAKIGVSIEPVGYGILEERDRVTIHGSYVEEIFVEHKEPIIYSFNSGGSGGGGTPGNSGGNSLGNAQSLSNHSTVGN